MIKVIKRMGMNPIRRSGSKPFSINDRALQKKADEIATEIKVVVFLTMLRKGSFKESIPIESERWSFFLDVIIPPVNATQRTAWYM
jgi:hypothetical protein